MMDVFILLSVVQEGGISGLRSQFLLGEAGVCHEIYEESVIGIEFASLAVESKAAGIIDLVSVIINPLSFGIVFICLEYEYV